MKTTMLRTLRIRNFKAIRDSGTLKLTPLTVLIGNNGSGKSSLLESLETVQRCVEEHIDAALQMWRGIEHVRNKARQLQIKAGLTGELRSTKPIMFQLAGRVNGQAQCRNGLERAGGGERVVLREGSRPLGPYTPASRRQQRQHRDRSQRRTPHRPAGGEVALERRLGRVHQGLAVLVAVAAGDGGPDAANWPKGASALPRTARISPSSCNIRDLDRQAFDGIVETLQAVLPYAEDVQPVVTSELDRKVYLQLTERDFKVPGWLLSSGTLRILALLAVLHRPTRRR